MMNRVTLLEPLARIDGRKVQFLRDVFGGEVPLSCPYPPLELAFCASVLRQAEIPVELIPANVLGLEHAQVTARLAADPPAMVVMPSAWGSIADDLVLMQQLRTALPRTRLVMFGPNVTAQPHLALDGAAVDCVILGEPEEAVLRLATNTTFADIPNLAYLRGGQLQQTQRRLPPDWERYPLPARDLLPLERYTVPFARRHPCTTMVTTRGCPSTCNFCPSHIWHHRTVRPRPIDLVMEEIDELVTRYGIRGVILRDDTFTWDRDRVLAFCDALQQRGHDLTWRCFATADTVDPALLTTMASAGCTQICYGFESGDDAILGRTGKGTTVQQGFDAAHWTHAAGMEVSGTFLVGLEGDTRATIDKSIAFAKQADLDYVQVNVATPLPGTGFGKRHVRSGGEQRHDDFRWLGTNTGKHGVDLAMEAKRFYRAFYLRPAYILGRLRSRRGTKALLSHARLGSRMVMDTLR